MMVYRYIPVTSLELEGAEVRVTCCDPEPRGRTNSIEFTCGLNGAPQIGQRLLLVVSDASTWQESVADQSNRSDS